MPSGLTAVLVATSPFWMVGIDALMPDGDPITLRRTLGLVIGFGGIVMLVWPEIHLDAGGRGFLGGVIVGADRVRRLGDRILVRAVARARSRQRGERARDGGVRDAVRRDRAAGRVARARRAGAAAFTPRTAARCVYLTLVGAIGGFSAYAYALKHLPVATVSLYAYVNPIIAVVLGTLVLQ